MKKALVFCLLVTLFFSHSVEAKILRVAYSGPAVAGVDYPNVQAAVNAAAVDDTIQLYQNASVGITNVNKKLVFIGFGYSQNINPGLQVVVSTNATELYFQPGSDNSRVEGVYGNFYIGVEGVTITRCSGLVRLGWNGLGNAPNLSNATIISSYVNIEGTYKTVSNALISNCIITGMNLTNIGGLVSNNIIFSASNFGPCVLKNNVFASTGFCVSGSGAVFQNNLFARHDNCGIAIVGSNNQFNVNMTNVFVNWNNGNWVTESNLALKSGSPAIGFGVDGNGSPTDAGIYGGEPGLVYKPSGIPAIPAIYQLTSPGLNANTNPYTITVSVRSNN